MFSDSQWNSPTRWGAAPPDFDGVVVVFVLAASATLQGIPVVWPPTLACAVRHVVVVGRNYGVAAADVVLVLDNVNVRGSSFVRFPECSIVAVGNDQVASGVDDFERRSSLSSPAMAVPADHSLTGSAADPGPSSSASARSPSALTPKTRWGEAQ